MNRLLLIFVDGVGLAGAGPSNPFSTVPMPAMARLLGGPLTSGSVQVRSDRVLTGLDAALGVPGLPQSATGQTALLTGRNAPQLLGRHVAAYHGPRLRALLAEHSLLARAAAAGHSVTFANPFSRHYFAEVAEGRRRLSATTWSALAAGLRLRGVDELARGEAVSWDVERDQFAAYLSEPIAQVTAREAGGHLAGLVRAHSLVLYETFMTDLAGHGRFGWTAAEALRRLDSLLAGTLAAIPPDATLLLTSDHGNLEDDTQRRHTRNPVPLLAVGPRARGFAALTQLTGVAPGILAELGVEEADAEPARKSRSR